MDITTSETNNAVRIVTLNRPKALNAFNQELFDALCEEFLDASQDQNVKVLVLTGAGRAFSAGADLKARAAGEHAKPKHGLEGMLEAIINFPKPLIVAANGLGVGIGCTLLGLGDMTFVSQSSRFRALSRLWESQLRALVRILFLAWLAIKRRAGYCSHQNGLAPMNVFLRVSP